MALSPPSKVRNFTLQINLLQSAHINIQNEESFSILSIENDIGLVFLTHQPTNSHAWYPITSPPGLQLSSNPNHPPTLLPPFERSNPSILAPQIIPSQDLYTQLASPRRERKKAMAEAAPTTATNGADNAQQQDQAKVSRHQEVGHKSLLQSDALYQYILETSVYPREPAPLRELREVTAKHPWNLMTTSPDEGQFLMMLLKLINAKKTMEIGVYTGYSLLSTALALPEDGKIIAMDINRENYEIGLPMIEKAGVAHKIDFREGPALPALDEMLEKEEMKGYFDFIFVDADKDNYLNYHARLIDLVKVGGVIGYDNTLWNGSVAQPADAPMRKYVRYYRDFVIELNKALAADTRIEISQIPISDGITLCRRVC